MFFLPAGLSCLFLTEWLRFQFRDPGTGVVHDYCGKTHAFKAKEQGLLPAPLANPYIDAKYQGNIGHAAGNYDVSRLTPRHNKYANIVVQFESQWKHSTAVPTVVSILQIRNTAEIYQAYEETANRLGNQQRRWHGTSCAPGCNFVMPGVVPGIATTESAPESACPISAPLHPSGVCVIGSWPLTKPSS